VSLFVNLLPIQTNVCPDGDISKLPPVKVTGLKLKLRSTTLVRCPSRLIDDESFKYHDYRWELNDPINYTVPIGGIKATGSIHQPEVPLSKYLNATPSSPAEFLDLGSILKLGLTPLKTAAQGAISEQLPRPVWPTFKTFSINVSYDIMYELKLECMDEIQTVNNYNYARTEVVIVPPAHDKTAEMKTKEGDIDWFELTSTAGGFANTLLGVFVPAWPF
jgi:hypothetical protein